MKSPSPILWRVRLAVPEDLPVLISLEESCFEPARRSAVRNLRHSLRSPAQRVWLATDDHGPAGALICLLYPRCLRVYSLCTHPRTRGRGLGSHLLRLAEAHARETDRPRISLEAAENDTGLIQWYHHRGYRTVKRLPDYYAPGVHALRMTGVSSRTK